MFAMAGLGGTELAGDRHRAVCSPFGLAATAVECSGSAGSLGRLVGVSRPGVMVPLYDACDMESSETEEAVMLLQSLQRLPASAH